MPIGSQIRAAEGSIYGAEAPGPVDGDFVAVRSPTLYRTLVTLGLLTNLQVCIDDATDSTQYPSGTTLCPADQTGSAQAWRSVQLYNLATQPAWSNNIHKDNALCSIVAFYYHGLAATAQGIAGHDASTAGPGFDFPITAADKTQFFVGEGVGTALSKTADTALTVDTWNMIGVSIDEATGVGGGFFYLNGGYNQVAAANTFDATYASPNAAASSNVIQIGASGGNSRRLDQLGRIACIAIWGGSVITKANMDSIWAAMRTRFGL